MRPQRLERLVIVGLPRSGTTLVATLLAAQAGIHFLTDYFSAFADARVRLGQAWNAPLSLSERRIALALVRDQFLRVRHAVLIRPEDFDTLDGLHAAVLGELAAETDLWAGHKLLLDSKWLRAFLAETSVYCLILFRDPRDAALSYFHRTGGGVERYLRNWSQTVRLWHELRDHPRLLGLRFEDLVSDPDESIARLGQWLRHPLENVPELHFQRTRAHGAIQWKENSAFRDVTARFDRRPVGRWQTCLESPIVRYASWVTRAEQELLGYDTETVQIPPRDRLRFSCLGALDLGERELHEKLGSAARWLRQRLSPHKSGWGG